MSKKFRSNISGKKRLASLTMAAIWSCQLLAAVPGWAAPTDGVVVSGTAAISQTGNITNINQSTQAAAINWQGFSIGSNETVNFNQPNASSVTLNRVVGNESSVINGALNANGQVFLVNSNGILFGQGASVNTGGFVASTLGISDEDFNAGKYIFKGGSTSGSVINMGTITAKDGGYVGLLGNSVSNQGVITATKGTVALASGNAVTLNFNGDSMVSVTVDEGVLNALVENKQAIYADGGTVILTAKAAEDLLSAQVNNSGIIQAQTVDDLKGTITLLADGGTTTVDGTLDASAPTTGNGGFIETSGDTVTVSDTAVVTTLSAAGNSGTWLIDPTNFTIAYGSGGQTTSSIGATTLQKALANGNVAITTASSGTEAGDINIDAALTWTAANSLTLTAAGDINANAALTWSAGTLTLNAGKNVNVNATLTGKTAGSFAANWGTGTNSDGTPYGLYTLQGTNDYSSFAGGINFSGTGTVTLNGIVYTVITTSADLAKIAADPTGHYVIGANYLTTSGLTAALGSGTAFTGVLDGFGHYISYSSSVAGSGLFDTIGVGGVVRNIGTMGTIDSAATVPENVGGLANVNRGTILNSFGAVTFQSTQSIYNVGGLVGLNEGTIMMGISTSNIYASDVAGGLVGTNAKNGVISLSIARDYPIYGVTGDSSIAYVGGLVGINYGSIERSWSNMAIQLTDSTAIAGGLVGLNAGTIDQCYAARYVKSSSWAAYLAGFVGINTGTITDSYSTFLYDDPYYLGTTISTWIAGFAYKNAGTIANCYATTYAYDTATHAGFVYDNTGGTTTNDYWYAGLASTATAYSDHSTARHLTETEAANFASYAGFSSDWAASTSGYAILKNTPVYLSGSGTYGSSLSSLLIIGQQGGGGQYNLLDGFGETGDTALYVLDGSGYIDAGYSAAASAIGSTHYSNIRGILNIDQKALTFGSGTIADKVYDGTTAATVGTVSLVGLVGDQTLTVTGLTGTFANANAGIGKAVTLTGYTLSDGTGKASNYTISNSATTAGITPKTLTVSSADVSSKIYDGATTATVNSAVLSGVVGSDGVSLGSYTANFTDKNVGADKSVVISNVVLTGSSAGNYTVSSAAFASTADITPTVLTLYGTSDGSSTTVSNLSGTNIIPGDTVNITGSVTIDGTTAGSHAISSLGTLNINNTNYTLTGSTGTVVVGDVSRVLAGVVGGDATATVVNSGNDTTIHQYVDSAVIDWYRFNIKAGETVTFDQPNSYSIALNRVIGSEASVLAGNLTSNGRVFIINSNGVLFASGSSVNVGALVASTLNLTDSDFLAGNYVFNALPTSKGTVVQEDYTSIEVADGGFLAFAGNKGVTQAGSITAKGGDVLLVSADKLTLALNGTDSGLKSYAMANLNGTTTVGGTITLGTGGLLETAGNKVAQAGTKFVPLGANITWSWSLPGSITIGDGGTFTSAFVNEKLEKLNLSLNAMGGDLTVNGALTWSADTTLTLGAAANININNAITIGGASAGLTMNYGGYNGFTVTTPAAGTNYNIRTKASYSGTVLDADGNPTAETDTSGGVYGSITFTDDTNLHGLTINGNKYTLIHSLDELDGLDQCMDGKWYDPVSGTYVQTADSMSTYLSISAAGYSGGYCYDPATQAYTIPYSKDVNGTPYYYNPELGEYVTTAYGALISFKYYYDMASGKYTIPGIKAGQYWNPATASYAAASYTGKVQRVYFNIADGCYNKLSYNGTNYYDPMTGEYTLTSTYRSILTLFYDPVTGKYDLPAAYASSGYYALAENLAGSGTTYDASLIKNFTGTLAGLGHTIETLSLNITNTQTSGSVYEGMISVAAAGSVIRDFGLINPTETISFSSSSQVSAMAGALAGVAYGTVSQVYVEDGTLTLSSGTSGGLIGFANGATVADCYATLSGATGGLICRAYYGSVVRSHATGDATGGGLINYVVGTLIDSDYATGAVGVYKLSNPAGGLIGYYETVAGYGHAVTNSFATGAVTGAVQLGGLIGYVSSTSTPMTITNCYATGAVSGDYASSFSTLFGLGGLVGDVYGSVNISDCFAAGAVTAGSNVYTAGGLVGSIRGLSSILSTITDSYALGAVTTAGKMGSTGGLVGDMSNTTVSNCYAKGAVTGYNGVGGLAGSANKSSIIDSYTTGLITATKGFGLNTVVGGIVGTGSNITLINSYYNAELNAGHVVNGYGNSYFGRTSFSDASTGLNSGQMQDVASYANGTIRDVLANRAAVAAAQARQEAFQADAVSQSEGILGQTQQESGEDLPRKKATEGASGGRQGEGQGSFDDHIVYADSAIYGAGIKSISADGVEYNLEGDNASGAPSNDELHKKKK